jgi:aspartate racemase
MTPARHVGIVAVSAEGAALCYRTICEQGATFLGPHDHPEVSMHTYPLARYMRLIDDGRWDDAGRLLLDSAAILARAGAEILVGADNTLHQALDHVREQSPLPWLHIAEEVAAVAVERRFTRLGVLGTRYVTEGPVYPRQLDALGIAHEIPTADERARINEVIVDELRVARGSRL